MELAFFFLHSSSSMFAEARAWTCSWLVGFFTIPLYALLWKSLKSKKPKSSETPWNWTSVHYASRLWGITLQLSQERGLVCQAVAKVCAERLGGSGNACLGPLRWPCKVQLVSLSQKFEYVRVKPDFYKFTQSVCCSLPFKLNILFFAPGRKTPRRAPIVAALSGDRLLAVTLAPALQQQLQPVLDKQCPSICSAVHSRGCLSPCFAYTHEEATAI